MSLTPPTDTKRASTNLADTVPDKPRPDISRYLKTARAKLQANNLSGAKSQLAAAIAAEPRNRDALNLRATVRTREEERDALLSLARGCGYIGRWTCVSRNAGEALQIDSGSKEARHLVTRAMHETAFPIDQPTVEPQPEPQPDTRDILAHH
ncbi:hypothetical protein [Paraburkholderia fungorum]|uniref:hypothetical protein n=1 Tax=Paraburkholderia fungorum TaxID=134537 RepID=UPI0009440DB3|nr:hypothetical protein [Paraburkholderia fungorum]